MCTRVTSRRCSDNSRPWESPTSRIVQPAFCSIFSDAANVGAAHSGPHELATRAGSQAPFRAGARRTGRIVSSLNRTARSVVDARRGKHAQYVFTHNGKPLKHMLNSAWKKARARAGLEGLRVHDLKHTFGRRLRAAGVSFEDRQDLLGHRSGRITTHYSAADLSRLIEAAESVAECDGRRPVLVVLRNAVHRVPQKSRKSGVESGWRDVST